MTQSFFHGWSEPGDRPRFSERVERKRWELAECLELNNRAWPGFDTTDNSPVPSTMKRPEAALAEVRSRYLLVCIGLYTLQL